MNKVTINDGQYSFDIEDNDIQGWDAIEFKNGCFHIIQNNRSFNAEVLSTDFQQKEFVLKVNQHSFTVNVADKFDLLIKQMGLSYATTSKVNQVKAPMPGLVLKITAEAGQAVEKGDALLILEAMKMENVIKSPGPGTVKKISVSQGDAVEKNQILIEFE